MAFYTDDKYQLRGWWSGAIRSAERQQVLLDEGRSVGLEAPGVDPPEDPPFKVSWFQPTSSLDAGVDRKTPMSSSAPIPKDGTKTPPRSEVPGENEPP